MNTPNLLNYLKKCFFIYVLMSSNLSFGQYFNTLDVNNIVTKIFSNGVLFEGKFEVPKNSGKQTIYSSNLWVGGYDESGDLHLAAQTYAQSGFDFFFGPIANNDSSVNFNDKYNNVWKIDKPTIDYHIKNYKSTSYKMPDEILKWPGNGDVTNGELLDLAPYVDVNENKLYDPANGDYPAIRGDQAIFYMVNDAKKSHTESGGKKLGIEIHGMAYSYYDTLGSPFYETVFVNYKIINRSKNNYKNLYLGVWTDTDLGNYKDDYIGSDSALNMFYTYNGDNTDEGILGYGFNPPAQGIMFLNNPVSKILYYTNDDTSSIGNPFSDKNYYSYLTGKWKDNTDMTFGGNGYGGKTKGNFMFSGKPEFNQGWTEAGTGNLPGDRRGIMSNGPLNLPAGSKICLDVAYPYARNVGGGNTGALLVLRQRAQAIRDFYNSQGFKCDFLTGTNDKYLQKSSVKIYPNPSYGNFTIKSDLKISRLEVTNLSGVNVYTSELNSDNAEIDLSNLPKGIYFYKLLCESNILMPGKIVLK